MGVDWGDGGVGHLLASLIIGNFAPYVTIANWMTTGIKCSNSDNHAGRNLVVRTSIGCVVKLPISQDSEVIVTRVTVTTDFGRS